MTVWLFLKVDSNEGLYEVWRTDTDGLPIVRHGEWSWGDWGEHIDMDVLMSAWYYLALKALFLMNEPAFALERMKVRYENMLSYEEYTTVFEGWDIHSGTINHAWSGGPLTVLSQKVCGVEPTSPGFRTFRVTPQLGFLTEASTTIASVNGEISVSVSQKGQKMKVKVKVPEGVTAEVVFPKGKPAKVGAGEHTLER
jgi:hypothetical protein